MQENYVDQRNALKPYMIYGERTYQNKSQSEQVSRDLEYFKSLYPMQMKQVQTYVSRACDKMDYKNSPIYDEFPDRVMIDHMCREICNEMDRGRKVESINPSFDKKEVEEVEVYEVGKNEIPNAPILVKALKPQWGPPSPPPPRPPWGPPSPPPPPRPPWGPPSPPPPPRPPWGPPSPPPPRPPWGPPSPPPPRPPWGPPSPPPPRPPWGPPPPPRPNWMNDIVKILLLHEIHGRRCRNGFC